MCNCFTRGCRSKSERDSVRHEITYILLKIQEDLLKGFLVVPLRDDKRIWSAAIISGVGSVALEDIGCPQGSYSTDKGCSKYIKLCTVIFICPIAIAYSYETDNKISLRLSVCLCVCLSVRVSSLSRSHFFVDFHQI